MVAPDSPACRTLTAQLNAVSFVSGVEEGRWRVLEMDFPHLYVKVTVVHPDMPGNTEAEFHLICDGYPNPGPFVEAWSSQAKARPTPPSVGAPGYVDALKNWEENGRYGGIYRAWQRYAALHNGWAGLRPEHAWNTTRDITFIMERLYDLVSEQAGWLAARQAA